MKGIFNVLAVGLLAIDGVAASRCRPNPSASASSVSSVSSTPSISPSASSVSSGSSAPSISPSASSVSPNQPVCTNLVAGGNFKDGLASWSFSNSGGTGAASWTTQDCSPDCAQCAELIVNDLDNEVWVYMSQDILLQPNVAYTLTFQYYKEVDSSFDQNPLFDCLLQTKPNTDADRRRSAGPGPGPGLAALEGTTPLRRVDGVPLAESRRLAGRLVTAPQFTPITHYYTPSTAQNILVCTLDSYGASTFEIGSVVVMPSSCDK